jgi:hypothetical protein
MADETTPEPTDLATRLAALEQKLATETEAREAAERTLSTLQQERRQPSPGPRGSLARLSREEAQDLSEELGWTVEQVHQHYPVIEAMFRRAAAPVLHGLSGVVDTLDDVDARTDLADWKDVKDDVEKVRKEHVARGEFITRKKAAALVKAQRLSDPAYLDRLADERAKQREAEAATREGERVAATTEGTRPASQGAGPSQGKASSTNKLDPETFRALPVEEKRKVLEDSALTF